MHLFPLSPAQAPFAAVEIPIKGRCGFLFETWRGSRTDFPLRSSRLWLGLRLDGSLRFSIALKRLSRLLNQEKTKHAVGLSFAPQPTCCCHTQARQGTMGVAHRISTQAWRLHLLPMPSSLLVRKSFRDVDRAKYALLRLAVAAPPSLLSVSLFYTKPLYIQLAVPGASCIFIHFKVSARHFQTTLS